ncbi:MAG: hypothetical protein E7457_07340, partial [Ruminococcaceae bacterium]|nr:hypothetical protein [Oscillospiraceae bacterium]
MKKITLIPMLLAILWAMLLTAGAAHDVREESGTWVNPAYGEMVQFLEQPAALGASATPAPAAEPVYGTYDQAVEQLRAGLQRRDESITVHIVQWYAPMGSYNPDLLKKGMAHTGQPKQGDYIRYNMSGCRYDTSYYLDGDYYVTVTLTPYWLTTAEQEAEVDAAVAEVLSELDLYHAGEYEKIVGVYDYITENVQYDFNNYDDPTYLLKHSTYAALIQKEAVCQGYATLLYRLLLELGVDCRVITGLGTGENHAWNIVKLEGKYYNADATWDRDLKGYYRNFLCSDSNFGEHFRDSEYTSASFYAQYPMADTSYVIQAGASGTLSNGMTWVLDENTGCLTVSGKGAIPSYRFSDPPWEAYKDNVRSIVLSEGITEVGERAFDWCKNATSVTLPQSLVAIREYGFNNLRALPAIELPPNLKILEFCAFSECPGLKEIVLPDSVTTVGTSVFSNCPGLERAVLSAGMTHVPDSMFFNDTRLKEVVLPDSITSIGDTAFNSCEGLKTFRIPAKLTSLGDSVFAGCTAMTNIYVDAGNPVFRDIDGVLCSGDGKTLLAFPVGRSGTYSVPAGITTIASSAFGYAVWLNTVTFPDSVTRIENYAFSWCERLRAVTLGKNVQYLGDSAFRGCKNMTSVTMLNDDLVLDGACFAECDSLTSVKLPARLKEIPYGLFYGAAILNDIQFPATVTKIGSSAFLDCDSLISVTIPGTVKTVGRQAFDFCDYLTVLELEPGVERLEEYSIRNSPWLMKVTIPRSVTYIGKECFDNCPSVTIWGEAGSCAEQYAKANNIPFRDTHTHSYAATSTVQPTCTQEGYTIYTCAACGDSYPSDYTSARGHTVVIDPAVAATCTTSGLTQGSHCGVCQVILVQREMTHALGHTIVTVPGKA